MKKNLRAYFLGVLSAIFIISAIPTIAKTTKETAQLIYNNYILYVNGKKTTIEPVSINGTAYVPLKNISEALKTPLSVEGSTFYLGDKPVSETNVVDLFDYAKEHPFYNGFLHVKDKTIYDTDYFQVQQVKYPITNVIDGDVQSNDILMLNGQFKTLKAYVGIDDRTKMSYGYLGIYDKETRDELYCTDGLNTDSTWTANSKIASKYKRITRGSNPAIQIEIDVSNVNQLWIDQGWGMSMFNVQLIKK